MTIEDHADDWVDDLPAAPCFVVLCRTVRPSWHVRLDRPQNNVVEPAVAEAEHRLVTVATNPE